MRSQLQTRSCARKPTEGEENEMFPIVERRPVVRTQQPLQLAVGHLGAAAINQAVSRCAALAPLCLTESATKDDLERAMRALTSSAGDSGWVLSRGSLELVATGHPKEIEAAVRPLIERLRVLGDERPVALTTIELGQPSAVPALEPMGLPAAARFHLATAYYHSRLSAEHQADLAGRLLATGLATALTERSGGARGVRLPVALGGALLWEPEATIAQLVAPELELQCFRTIASPGQGAVRSLGALLRRSAPHTLAERLKEQLRREETEFIERLFDLPETAPLESLLKDAHTGEEEAAGVVSAWCDEAWRGARGALYELLTGRHGLRTGLATLERAERMLRQVGGGLATREQKAAAKRRSLAHRAVGLDLKRRDAARRWLPLRHLLLWLRGRKLKKILRELFRERAAELVARYEKDALERLRRDLGAVHDRFAAILDAQPDEEILWQLLRPGYRNLVPRHEPETLGSVLRALVLALGAALRDSPAKRTWAAAVGELLDAKPGPENVQNAIAIAAKLVSDDLPAGANPFATALHEMLPDRDATALATLLTWAARPRTSADSQPWVEEVVTLPNCKGLLLNAVVCIYWPK
jgi:hypothetical protein